MQVKDILDFLKSQNFDYEFEGNSDVDISGFSSIYHYKKSTISWARNVNVFDKANKKSLIDVTCLISSKEVPFIQQAESQIRVSDPKDVFFTIVDHYWGEDRMAGISEKAYVEKGALIGNGTYVGAFTFISGKTVIGENCYIGSNVTIKGKVTIGNNCVIQSGAVLGEDGFAFIRNPDSVDFVKHYGGVRLGNNVSIGSNTCVCRGAIDDTTLEDYVKVDNLCHIAHNVHIGKRTIVVCETSVMGSVHIGSDCWVATSMIRDQRQVGDNTVVGMGAVVVNDVPDNTTVAGNPAKPFKRKEKI